MLARKLIMLACFLCAGSTFATEVDEAITDAMSGDYPGIVADKIVASPEPVAETETVATGGEESRPGGSEEVAGDSKS